MNQGLTKSQRRRAKQAVANKRVQIARITIEMILNSDSNIPSLTQSQTIRRVAEKICAIHRVDMADRDLAWVSKSAQHFLSSLRKRTPHEIREAVLSREYSVKDLLSTSLRKHPSVANLVGVMNY